MDYLDSVAQRIPLDALDVVIRGMEAGVFTEPQARDIVSKSYALKAREARHLKGVIKTGRNVDPSEKAKADLADYFAAQSRAVLDGTPLEELRDAEAGKRGEIYGNTQPLEYNSETNIDRLLMRNRLPFDAAVARMQEYAGTGRPIEEIPSNTRSDFGPRFVSTDSWNGWQKLGDGQFDATWDRVGGTVNNDNEVIDGVYRIFVEPVKKTE
jgi:hypothetical protein